MRIGPCIPCQTNLPHADTFLVRKEQVKDQVMAHPDVFEAAAQCLEATAVTRARWPRRLPGVSQPLRSTYDNGKTAGGIGDASQGISHPVNPATLPCGPECLGDGGLEAFISVGGNQLHAGESSTKKAFQEKDQNDSASLGPMCNPTISRRPSRCLR